MIVAGANHANIGEILNNTGNPTFEVGNDQSLKAALAKIEVLLNENHGVKNKKTAFEKWGVKQIASQYIHTMQESLKIKDRKERPPSKS